MIRKLLVANRGEIASRIFRTARGMGIATVAVFSDADAQAPFVAEADEAVRLPGAAPSDTYLRGDLLVTAARATGADAVHPGYGFLSENAQFAQTCLDAGLVFVGPPPAAIAAMGSKLEAKRVMAEAGVPVLADAVLAEGQTDLDLRQAAEELGYPLLVKAAFGGGGRGMRVVHEPADLADAVASARREAASAFGDGSVYLERLVPAARHVEVQVFADTHGTVVHLHERECSIQRRHQKLVEEAPSPAVDDALRAELCAAAVTAARAIGYVGAGTVEFLLEPSRAFAFLEMNTRLQVEHPVTELVTGLDLVEQQLRVAEGEPLPTSVVDPALDGHAIEVRLYAEDVAAGFLPATGTLHRFRLLETPGVRVDAGVADGSVVSPHYDSLLAKVIAHGPTRADACRRLTRALQGAEIHGVITNRELLVGILREPEFLAGATDTGYLDRHDPTALGAFDETIVPIHAAAAALAEQARNRSAARVLPTMASGWRNVAGAPQRMTYTSGGRAVEVRYRFGRLGADVEVDGRPLELLVCEAARAAVVFELDGIRRAFRVNRVGAHAYVDSPLGSTTLGLEPRFPAPDVALQAGSLRAPMPGTVTRVLVEPGITVEAGQPLVVLEAMKMEHTVSAPADGNVSEVRVAPGDQVQVGVVLAVLDEAPE